MDIAPGSQLGPYRLIEKIGAGGMGEVWKGEDTRLGRVVAIKILPQAMAADPESRARLQREARTAAHLYHPNIATIHSIEESENRFFIVMQYVEGDPLSRLMRNGPMAEADICRIGKGVADALSEAHAQGIVHRDIKPDNIMVSGGRVKVLDFGIAKQMGAVALSSNDPTAFMTQQGMIIGTVFYMSPEQALGKQLDQRTDIFSLGVVLYEAATGKLPFKGESVTETITRIVRDDPEPPMVALPTLSPGLSAIIQKCLQKKREDRFESAAELGAALDAQLGRVATDRSSARASAGQLAATERIGAEPPHASSARGAAPTAMTASRNADARPGGGSRAILIGAVLFVLIGAIAVGAYFFSRTSEPTFAGAPPRQRPASVASSTVEVPALTTAASPPETVAESTNTATTVPKRAPQSNAVSPPRAPTNAALSSPHPDQKPAVDNSATATTAVPEKSLSGEPSPDELYARAVRHLRNGKAREARAILAKVLELDPHHAPARLRLAEITLLGRDFEAAQTEYRQTYTDILRLDGRERALLNLGMAISMHDVEKARTEAEKVDQSFPGDPELNTLRNAFPGILKGDAGGAARRRRFGRREKSGV